MLRLLRCYGEGIKFDLLQIWMRQECSHRMHGALGPAQGLEFLANYVSIVPELLGRECAGGVEVDHVKV